MYEIQSTTYGFEMRFGGYIDIDEMYDWANAVQAALPKTPREWHCFVDMRELETMSSDGQRRMSEVKSDCHDAGLDRVATLLQSPTVRLQFQQMADGTGGDGSERYLDAGSHDDPVESATRWVRDGIDPSG